MIKRTNVRRNFW